MAVNKEPVKQGKARFSNPYPNIRPIDVKRNYKQDPDTGLLLRFTKANGWTPVSSKHPTMRCYITRFQKTLLRVPEVVWLLNKGHWPKEPIKALDGNLYNTKIENLVSASSLKERLGNYLVREEGKYWGVKVWHQPYFYKGNRFKYRDDAVAWAEKQLADYNEYAAATEAALKNHSEQKPTPIDGVRYNQTHYTVYLKINDEWKYHSSEKNIEDAVETQHRAQAEIDDIWQE